MANDIQLKIEGDPTQITFIDGTGDRWRVIKESKLEDWEREFNHTIDRLKNLDNRWLSRNQVKKRYHIGEDKLNRWIAEGLREITDGGNRLYDRVEIDQFIESKKR